MADYSQLMNLEKQKKPESLKARKDENLKGSNQESQLTGKPESPLSGNQAILNTRKLESRKVPKYSTQLEEGLQIQVSVYAKMHRMKDYEVVQHAIEDYLEKQKKPESLKGSSHDSLKTGNPESQQS